MDIDLRRCVGLIVILATTYALAGCGTAEDQASQREPAGSRPVADASTQAEPSEESPDVTPDSEPAGLPEVSGPRLVSPRLAQRQPRSAKRPPSSAKRQLRSAKRPPQHIPIVPKGAAPKRVSEEQPKPSYTSPKVADDKDDDYDIVEVYYGTDRAVVGTSNAKPLSVWRWRWASVAFAVGTIALLIMAYVGWRTKLAMTFATFGMIATMALAFYTIQMRRDTSTDGQIKRTYGHMRGSLELGTCKVSIPKKHQVGELESPSIFRFEFKQDPTKHVVLLDVTKEPTDAFFASLKKRIDRSSQKGAFVFIHGYNVTFEDAARRTAQIAYDLEFEGAPIFYSWPSQGGLLSYAVDETNVVWTVPHLRQFLTDIAKRSDAKNLHLIAHSMGNRALTSALRDLSNEMADQMPMFREVILTAPDIDADVFRRDIVPAIRKTADRVTLYASSNDEALIASKQFHGYPRAGDSGGDVVVIEGIDTIDVSNVDTSLLGHCYYGTNDTVLIDLAQLLREATPPDKRTRLRSMKLGAMRYWVFLKSQLKLTPNNGSPR